MLKFWKKNLRGQEYLYEEKPENENLALTGQNINILLGDSSDFIYRELYINGNKLLKISMCCIDGLIDSKSVSDDILKPLLQEPILSQAKSEKDIIDYIEHGTLYYPSELTQDNIDDTINQILNGSVALIFDQEHKAVTFDVKGFEKRSLQEPSDESVVKGAKDSFIEVIRVNTSLVRRKIRNQNLRIRQMEIGQQTLTPVAVCYIEGIADPALVDDLNKRLQAIDVEGVLITAAIEEYIIENKFSAFPQLQYTERPDKFCANLLEGRVGILIDGLPTAFIVPVNINQLMQAPEDYSRNYLVGSLISIIRYLSLIITLVLPGFYIGITTFHQEMIPTDLSISIIASKEGVPFPVFIEIIILLIAFEILLEAGIRMPKPIGQSVSIVGALVVGQAAVQAKLVSPAVVIIVAMAVIAGFIMPNQDLANALRLWRLILTISSAAIGLLGLSFGIIVLTIHLASIDNFGGSYLMPFAANNGQGIIKDSVLRLPMWTMKQRPGCLNTTNRRRQP
jgi:spore germination protein KA